MMLVLLISAAASSADADAANLAYVQCLFAQSRASHESRLLPDRFEALLVRSCRTEERALVSAAPEAAQTAAQARQMVVEDYRRTVELQPQLKRLGELCRARPDQCRD